MKPAWALLLMSLVAAPALCASAPKTPHGTAAYRAMLERAWAAALRPEHATGGHCWAKIGRDPALALAKYCNVFAPNNMSGCFSGDPCADITSGIYANCVWMGEGGGGDPFVSKGGTPDPKHLPCVQSFTTQAEWDNLRGVPAY